MGMKVIRIGIQRNETEKKRECPSRAGCKCPGVSYLENVSGPIHNQ